VRSAVLVFMLSPAHTRPGLRVRLARYVALWLAAAVVATIVAVLSAVGGSGHSVLYAMLVVAGVALAAPACLLRSSAGRAGR
jgi:hypothetical protein